MRELGIGAAVARRNLPNAEGRGFERRVATMRTVFGGDVGGADNREGRRGVQCGEDTCGALPAKSAGGRMGRCSVREEGTTATSTMEKGGG